MTLKMASKTGTRRDAVNIYMIFPYRRRGYKKAGGIYPPAVCLIVTKYVGSVSEYNGLLCSFVIIRRCYSIRRLFVFNRLVDRQH